MNNTSTRKQQFNLGPNIRRIIAFLEKYQDCLPEDIIKALADPKKNFKTERSKLYDSIKTMKKSGLVTTNSKQKDLRIILDDEYRRKKYPKPQFIRLNKENELYLRYKKLYRR